MVMRYRKELEEMARSWCLLTNQEPTEEILNAFISGGKLALENQDCIVNKKSLDRHNSAKGLEQIKSTLVHFFREGTNNDYLEALNNATKEIIEHLSEIKY